MSSLFSKNAKQVSDAEISKIVGDVQKPEAQKGGMNLTATNDSGCTNESMGTSCCHSCGGTCSGGCSFIKSDIEAPSFKR